MSGAVGKATISSEIGEGLYVVDLDYGSDAVNQKIANKQARVAELDNQISQRQSDLLTAAANSRDERDALDAAILAYRLNPTEENRSLVDQASKAATEAFAPEKKIESDLAYLRLSRSQVLSEIAVLQAESVTESKQAWCADYTETATGLVATVDVNGESQETIIVPGAEPPLLSDGEMTEMLALSGSATYLNAAIFPGWQKYSPTYRIGQIYDIDRENDTGSVTLYAANSSAQSLDINQTTTLTDVPIVYMVCNSAVFEDGDEVVVKFENQDWTQPKIIGFRTNPKQCGPERLLIPMLYQNLVTTTEPSGIRQGKDVITADVVFTPCVSGQYIINDQNPRPPGYTYLGRIFNRPSQYFELVPAYGQGEFLSSEDEYGTGGVGDFDWNNEFQIKEGAGPVIVFDTQANGVVISQPFGVGFRFRNYTTFSYNDFFITDVVIEQTNQNFNTADLAENADTISCITSYYAPYFSGIEQTIQLKTINGSGGINYEFERIYNAPSVAGDPNAPNSMLQGLCLGYRRQTNN